MSLWEYQAALEGYNRHHDPKGGLKAPTPEEHDAIAKRFEHLK